jgi:hypothetical protein
MATRLLLVSCTARTASTLASVVLPTPPLLEHTEITCMLGLPKSLAVHDLLAAIPKAER